MTRYKIKKTDILKDKKNHPEGSIIELTEKEAAPLKEFLIEIDVKEPIKKDSPQKEQTPKKPSSEPKKKSAETKPKGKKGAESKPEGGKVDGEDSGKEENNGENS